MLKEKVYQKITTKHLLSVGLESHRAQLRDDVSSIHATAGRLHTALGEGSGLDETLPTYRRLISSVRSASDELRRVQLGEPVAGKIEAAGAVLRRLRPYYEEEPPI